jgi:hypothetical protein
MLSPDQLEEAICEIEMLGIFRDKMVILAPVHTLAKLTAKYFPDRWGISALHVPPGEIPRFGGVLMVEDQLFTNVIVKSLISMHRYVVGEEEVR